MDISVPIAIRIAGTREEEGRELLRGSEFTPEPDLVSAARIIIRKIEEKR
jgi:succinyl-CoA synthetase beta subunit